MASVMSSSFPLARTGNRCDRPRRGRDYSQPVSISLRPLTPDDFAAAWQLLQIAFGDKGDDEDVAAEQSVFEYDRSVGAFSDGDLVGCLSAWSFELSLPHGALPAAGTTWVAVSPTHRRRGVLRALMDAHLGDVARRGEPLAALWASEAPIYGRFGYGSAAERLRLTVDLPRLHWRDDVDVADAQIRLVRLDDAETLLDPIYEAVRRRRPGMHRRGSKAWWHYKALSTREEAMDGASVKAVAVASVDGEPAAYAIYGLTEHWPSNTGTPAGTITVHELAGVDDAAEASLWRYLCSHDLVTTLKASLVPADVTLPWLVTDPRRVGRQLYDALWLRIIDVPAALTARGWHDSAQLTVQVIDDVFASNDDTWRLEVAPEGAVCERAPDAEPDVTMTVESLGALYLGGTPLARLTSAGRVRVRDRRAADELDRALWVRYLPWAPEVW